MKVQSVLALDVHQTFQGYLKENIYIKRREIFGLNKHKAKVKKERLFSEYSHLFQKD